MVQEGHCAIPDTIVEKRIKARGPGLLQGKKRANQTLAAVCNKKEWIQGIEEHDSEVGLGNGTAGNCRVVPRNAQPQDVSRGRRCHKRQGRPPFPQDASGGSPSSGGGSLD